MNPNLEWLKQTQIRYNPSIASYHPWLAPVVSTAKRLLRKLFTFVGVPLVTEINAYHLRLVAEVEALRQAAAERSELDALRGDMVAAIEALRGDMNAAIEALHGDMNAAIEALHGDMVAAIEVLRGDMNAAIEALREQKVDQRELETLRIEIAAGIDALRNKVEDRRETERLNSLTKLHGKMIGTLVLEQHKHRFGIIDEHAAPTYPSISSLANRRDFMAHSDWLRQMRLDPSFVHRKYWEWIYIAQVLFERHMLTPGKRGLGFAVGNEPLPALFARYGVKVTATDLDENSARAGGWIAGNQHASGLSALEHPDICDRDTFYYNVSFMPLDMNDIPDTVRGFDFCWSSCAFEHLGTVQQGRDFIRNTLKLLNPGGISVHTTEYNISYDESRDTPNCALYGKNFFESLRAEMIDRGHYFAPLDYRLGNHPDEDFVFMFDSCDPHFKILADDCIATSIGIIIVKAGGTPSPGQ